MAEIGREQHAESPPGVWESAPGHTARSFEPRFRRDRHVFAGVVGVAAVVVAIGAVLGAASLGAQDDGLAEEHGRGAVDATALVVVEQHGSFTVRARPARLQTRGVSYSGTISAATPDRERFGTIDLVVNEDSNPPFPTTPAGAPPPASVGAHRGGAGAAADVGHRYAHPDLLQDPKELADSAHIWGTATATLGGVACEGPLSITAYSDSGEGGGALALRCTDGSVLAGELRLANRAGATPSGWEATLELTGFYTAGD